MKKIKIFTLVAVIITMGFVMAGCGKDTKPVSDDNVALEQASSTDLSKYLIENIEFKDSMSIVYEEIFFSLYDLDEIDVKEVTLYASTGATAEEVAVIKTKDGKAEAVEKACRKRIEAQKQGFEDYVPKELEKLEKPVIMKAGNSVIMVVCDDREAAEKLLANYENTEV
ncbi:MAG: DUF4358 domain-containing protein [Aminipila sp.]